MNPSGESFRDFGKSLPYSENVKTFKSTSLASLRERREGEERGGEGGGREEGREGGKEGRREGGGGRIREDGGTNSS